MKLEYRIIKKEYGKYNRIFSLFSWFLGEVCSIEVYNLKCLPNKVYYIKKASYNDIDYKNFLLIEYNLYIEIENRLYLSDAHTYKVFELDEEYEEEEAPTLDSILDYDKINAFLGSIKYSFKTDLIFNIKITFS